MLTNEARVGCLQAMWMCLVMLRRDNKRGLLSHQLKTVGCFRMQKVICKLNLLHTMQEYNQYSGCLWGSVLEPVSKQSQKAASSHAL